MERKPIDNADESFKYLPDLSFRTLSLSLFPFTEIDRSPRISLTRAALEIEKRGKNRHGFLLPPRIQWNLSRHRISREPDATPRSGAESFKRETFEFFPFSIASHCDRRRWFRSTRDFYDRRKLIGNSARQGRKRRAERDKWKSNGG